MPRLLIYLLMYAAALLVAYIGTQFMFLLFMLDDTTARWFICDFIGWSELCQ